VQPGACRCDGVRLESVADVGDLFWGEAEPGAAPVEDLRAGLGGTGFAGGDDIRQLGGESDVEVTRRRRCSMKVSSPDR
jgi:hypothetical protein